MPKELYIEFKTKAFPVIQADESKRLAIKLKQTLGRSDCNLQPSDHAYFNSDLFPAMLNGAYQRIVNNRTWIYLDELPEGLTVDTSKFLVVVRIALEPDFRGR